MRSRGFVFNPTPADHAAHPGEPVVSAASLEPAPIELPEELLTGGRVVPLRPTVERILDTETKVFRVPSAAFLRAGMLAAGVALSAPAAAAQHAAQRQQEPASSEVQRAARDFQRMQRRDESLQAGGLVKPFKSEEKGPNPWLLMAVMATVAGGVAKGIRFMQAREREAQETSLRKAYVEALGSPFRNVRLDALSSIQRCKDFRAIPVDPLLAAAKDHDPAISVAAKNLLARHPDTPVEILKILAERESVLSVRIGALKALETPGRA